MSMCICTPSIPPLWLSLLALAAAQQQTGARSEPTPAPQREQTPTALLLTQERAGYRAKREETKSNYPPLPLPLGECSFSRYPLFPPPCLGVNVKCCRLREERKKKANSGRTLHSVTEEDHDFRQLCKRSKVLKIALS